MPALGGEMVLCQSTEGCRSVALEFRKPFKPAARPDLRWEVMGSDPTLERKTTYSWSRMNDSAAGLVWKGLRVPGGHSQRFINSLKMKRPLSA